MPSRWSRTYARHGCSSSRRRPTSAAPGFTLIEVVVAIGILSMVIISVFMLVTVSAANLKDSDMRNTATNIANYTIEYVRGRNVTSDNNFIGIGTSGWYSATNPSSKFPGLVDLGSNPVGTTPTALSINTNPVLPSVTPTADKFYSSLQGYVSLADTPVDTPVNGSLSSEDGNAKVVSGKYLDATPLLVRRALEAPYVVRFPLVSGASGIKNFTALTGYNGYIYAATTGTGTFGSDQHYTIVLTNKAGAMAYSGFRVLTQIVARKALAADPNHVQYYDVQVTVFWVLGNAEHSYSLATQIATYGAS